MGLLLSNQVFPAPPCAGVSATRRLVGDGGLGYSAKLRVLLCSSGTYDLPMTSSDAFPLSYRRLVVARPLDKVCMTNILLTARIDKVLVVSHDFHHYILDFGVQSWRSGESTHLPPMWPRFDSSTRRHTWVEFVGSLLCNERFSPCTPVSPLLKTQHLTCCVNC